jgi:phosphoglycerate dehydrogenase-like enzyme
MKPKILVTDDEVHVDNIIDELRTIADVTQSANNHEQTLAREAENADLIMVSCFTKITAAVLESAKNLKAVLKYGVGVDNIDIAAATQKNVILTPHLAWYTKQAQKRLEQETLQRTLEILEGRLPQNIKNPEILKKEV